MKQKMYWKNGFYDTPVDGAVEISVEYWKKLLDGQSSGKLIVTNDEGYPVLVENEYSLEDNYGLKVCGWISLHVLDYLTQSISKKRRVKRRLYFGMMQ